MVSYNDNTVVQYLRQYEMFANSLKLIKNVTEREMIIKQLTKLENKIIDATNESYEDEYYVLANKECSLIDEEKKRVTMLIDLINQRLSYVEKRCNDHYQLTGEVLDVKDVLGANTLDNLENRVRIIDKYSKNVKLQEELKNDVKSLNSKITLATEKVDINKNLNIELEAKFKSLLAKAFEENHLYELMDAKEEIEYAYYETEKSLTLAELNLETAKTSPLNVLSDCQEMLREVNEDYLRYKDKLSTLRLMEIFNREVNTYDELLKKRREVNDILKYIKNDAFIRMIIETVSKQYNTILMEQQDINTLNDLTEEKNRKLEALSELEEENESEEFQNVLKVLIENERKQQERIEKERQRTLEEEKKKRLEIEKKKQEEILKRQKIIEEARKKEIEKRTKQLLEEQQNSVLQNKKKEKVYSFETIKDNVNTKIESDPEIARRVDLYKDIDNKKIDDDSNLLDLSAPVEETSEEEYTPLKDKVSIEKELFEEFNNNSKKEKENTFLDEIDSKEDNNYQLGEEKNFKLPNISLDQYMKDFDEEKTTDNSDFFGSSDIFPSIPV